MPVEQKADVADRPGLPVAADRGAAGAAAGAVAQAADGGVAQMLRRNQNLCAAIAQPQPQPMLRRHPKRRPRRGAAELRQRHPDRQIAQGRRRGGQVAPSDPADRLRPLGRQHAGARRQILGPDRPRHRCHRRIGPQAQLRQRAAVIADRGGVDDHRDHPRGIRHPVGEDEHQMMRRIFEQDEVPGGAGRNGDPQKVDPGLRRARTDDGEGRLFHQDRLADRNPAIRIAQAQPAGQAAETRQQQRLL